jgi:flotillin
MIERKNKRTARIGVFAVAHNTYFSQFEGLYENLCGYHRDFCGIVGENDVEIIDFGIIDTSEKAYEAAEKIQAAKAREESYAAEKAAEEARRAKEQATLEADIIVRAEAKKKEMELEAEAEAEQMRRRAQGEADAIYAKMEAQARGAEEILRKQAAGFAEIVKSAGGDADAALKLLIADKLEDLMRVQVDAIKNIKIDKVTVWDNGQSADGKNATANFLSGMMKSVPPLQEVFGMAGMQLPEILGKNLPEETGTEQE